MEGLFQKAYRRLSEHICVNGLEQECSKEFDKLEHNAYRVDYLLQKTDTAHLFAFPPSKTAKDLEKASSLKMSGNKFFQKKSFKQALAAYNQALVLVPSGEGDPLLAICLANRSAALFSLQRYSDCMSDIEQAMKHGYPKQSMYKLLTRKAKCYQFVNVAELDASIKQAMELLEKSSLDNASKHPWITDLSKLSARPQLLSPTLSGSAMPDFSPSPASEHSALSSCVTVEETSEFGRFVQATEDICSGDVVLVEMPFCSVPLPDKYLSHCCSCQRKVNDTPYPCRSCADVVYCGEACEKMGWEEYHQYECDYILQIKAVDVNMGHLSLRSALKAEYEVVKSASAGRSIDTLESANGYGSIYDLQGHEEERTGKDLFWRTVAAVVLASMCDYNAWAADSKDGRTTLATAVLHHMDIFPCNAHEISELVYDSREPCKSELVEIGAGIYQCLSMFNHSCDPSVVRTFYKGNTCVMNALSPIQKSEQVYDNYGCLYATHSPSERQAKLRAQYYFECCCIACIQNWTLYDGMQYNDSPVYKCDGCSSIVLPPYGDRCDTCDTQFNKAAADVMLLKAKECFDKLLAELFSSNAYGVKDVDLIRKAKKLQDYSQLVNKLVCRPYKTLNDCQEALKHVYTLMGNVAISN